MIHPRFRKTMVTLVWAHQDLNRCCVAEEKLEIFENHLILHILNREQFTYNVTYD